MATIAKLSVLLGLNADPFAKGIKQAQTEASTFSKTMSHLGGVIGGALTVSAAINFGRESVAAFEESEHAARKLEAVLHATGGTAGISAAGIQEMATQMQELTAVEDDLIVNGAAVLASFKNISGVAFREATQMAADLSAVMGQDLQSSMTQIGKALNDPIQGLSALTRIGVSFTDQQKEQIKVLQESGDVLGAQKVILAELASEFGGAAEKMATDADKLRNKWGQFKEEVGGAITEVMSTQVSGGKSIMDGLLDIANMYHEGFAEIRKQLEGGGGSIELAGVSREEIARMNAAVDAKAATEGIGSAVPKATEQGVAMLDKLRESLEFDIKTFGMSEDAIERYRLKLEGVDPVTRQFIKGLQEQKAALEAEAEAEKKHLAFIEEQRKSMIGRTDQLRDQAIAGVESAEGIRQSLQTPFDSAASQLQEAQKLADEGFLDQSVVDQLTQKLAGGLAGAVEEVKFGGAALAGSQEDIAIRNRFLAGGDRKDEEKKLLQQQVTKLQAILDQLRDNGNQLQVVEGF